MLGQWQNAHRNKGRLDPISSLIQGITIPFAEPTNHSIDSLAAYLSGIFDSPRLQAENRRLRAMVKATEFYAEREKMLLSQVDSLRRIIGLPRYGDRKRIPAEIIGFFPYEDRITITAGKSQGVTPGLAVVSAEGLMGLVQTVSAKTSQVVLITSGVARVGASVVREPPQPGLLKGETSTNLTLEVLDTKASMEVGDWVATSGFSEKVPGGIPIGRVIKVESNYDFGHKRAVVFPSVRFGSVREVFVLK